MRYFIFILLYLKACTNVADGSQKTEKYVTCEYSDTDWQPIQQQLYTCDIFVDSIDSQNFKIQYDKDESEKVEGLRFNDNKGVKFLPNNIAELFPNIKGLTVSGTYLSTLSKSDLKGLSKLKYITFQNSDLRIIEDYSFQDLNELEELDMSDSNIQTIEENALHGLKSLKTLYLGGNKLILLEPKTFEGLTALNSLSLELNHLEYIDENLFATNENLADLWLNKNKIIGLQFKVFENLPALDYIDLQENPCIDGVFDQSNMDELKEILSENCTAIAPKRQLQETTKNVAEEIVVDDSPNPEYNIDGTVELYQEEFIEVPDIAVDDSLITPKTVKCKNLDINQDISSNPTCFVENQIIDSKNLIFEHDTRGSQFKEMSFAHNKHIKYLPIDIAQFAPNLERFTARNASLKIISRKNFAGLKKLKSLNLADNGIKFIDPDAFDDLTELEELDLSGNNLGDLDDEIFRKLKNLKTLRIGRNQMHSIHPNLLKNLRNLVNISISHQSISALNENTFKQNTKLQNVWMNSNKIKSLNPNMFSKLKNLQYVDIRDNKCIDKFYNDKNLQFLKTEIQSKCGAGYKLKMGMKIDDQKKNIPKSKKDKKNKKKLPKQQIKEEEEEGKEVVCDYEDIFWSHINKTLKTCVINEPIDDPHHLISVNPISTEHFVNGDTIQAISFRNNKNVKYLPKNLHQVFPNLIEFSAANAGLTTVNVENFKGLEKLKSIDLSGNGLSHIDRDAFKDLKSLEVLNLDDNEIEEFEEEIFTYTKMLKKLRMKGNKLKTIHVSWFEDMPELEEISFNLSSTVDLGKNTFEHNPKLKIIEWNGVQYDAKLNHLDMSTSDVENGKSKEIACKYDEITDIETGEMIHVCKIEESQIIDNRNFMIKSSPENNRVRKLVIVDNENIKYLPRNVGESFPFLEEIYVENTAIDEVEKVNFENLPYLRSLKLNKNKIHKIESDTFDELPQLEELDISDNSLEMIGNGAFYKTKNLRTLKLDKNSLHSIDPNAFKSLENLVTISLADNKIPLIHRHTFKHNPNLEIIELNGNNIESLSPKMFDKLKRLKRVSLTGNKCLNGDFDASQLSTLKTDITNDCKNPVQGKEITCDLKDVDSDVVDITTCVVNENVVIDEPGYEVTINTNSIDPSHVKSFIIENNDDIKHLPENIGEIFPNLETLKISRTSIENLPKDVFKDMPNVKDVEFSQNKLNVLYPNSFSGLNSVKKLNLSGNHIKEIYGTPFINTPMVSTIDFTGNDVKVPYSQLDGLTELETSLWDDLDSEVPVLNTKEVFCNDFDYDEAENVFTCLIKNQDISSSDFSLKMPINHKVSTLKIIGNSNVKYLPNNIHEIYPNVNSIEVHETNIEEVPSVINEFKNLKSLDLSGNKIKTLNPNQFHNLPNLEKLSLDQNLIDVIDESSFDLPNLKSLNLGNNKISTIPLKIFSKTPKLSWVSFDNNDDLTEINESIFEPVSNEILRYTYTKNGKRIKRFRKVVISDDDSEEEVYETEIEIIRKTTKKQKLKVTKHMEEEYEDFDVPITTEYTITNEVSCEFVKNDSDESNEMYTCLIHEQPIGSRDYRIKSSPLDLKVNQITIENDRDVSFLPMNIAENFPNIQKILVKNTSVSEIPGKMLNKLKKLKVLDLQDNDINELEPEMLNDLPMLKEINLSNNKIQKVPQDVFKNLPELEYLTLDGNEIPDLSTVTFDNLPKLKIMSITNHKNISSSSTDVTDETPIDIEEIECENGDLKTEHVETDDNIVQQTTCIIKHQDISSPNIKIKSSSANPDIRTLRIENNRNIKFLPKNIGEIFPTLEEIIIKNTSISDIPDKVLDNVKNLKTLDLSNNELEMLNPDILKDKPVLETLNLSDNKIKDLPVNIFDKLPDLKVINLNNNEFSDIDPGMFENLPKLTNLSINGNDLPDEFIDELAEKYPSVEILLPHITVTTDKTVQEVSTSDDVECQLEYSEWISIDPENDDVSNIFTCIIKNQPISNENIKIKSTPYDGHIHGLKLENNELVKFIPKGIGEQFPNVQKISIQNTSVSKIPSDVFDNLYNLISLDISDNKIKELDPEIFKTTPVLEEVDLSGNKIVEIPEDVLRNVPELKVINIENNEVTDLKPKMITHVPHLKKILLNGNDLPNHISEKLLEINPLIEIKKSAEPEESIDKIPDQAKTTHAPKTFTTSKPTIRPTPQQSATTAYPVSKTTIKRIKGKTTRKTTRTTTTTARIPTKTVNCELIYVPTNSGIRNALACEMKNEEIEDPEVSLLEVPNGETVEVLKLDNNKNIKYLPDNIAQVFPNLKEIIANNSGIDSILPGDFEDLKKLKSIILSGNEIKNIEPETFDGLKELKNIDLSNNAIDFVDEDAFGNLPSLTDLNLNNNELTFIHPKTFQNLPKLETINIEGNEIPSLPDNVFQNNPKIKEVKHSIRNFVMPKVLKTTTWKPLIKEQLSTVRTTSTTRKTTQSTAYVTSTVRPKPKSSDLKEIACQYETIYWIFSSDEFFSCDFKNATIDDPNYVIKPSPKNKRVKGLSFVGSKNVKFLPQNIDKVFPNLIEISAYETSIKDIPKDSFKNLPKLRSLNLMASNITKIDPNAFDDLHSLEFLDLSENNIDNLHPDTFNNLTSLKFLYLNNNKLTFLDPNIFGNLPELRNVSLEDNKLSEVDRKLFGKNFELQNVWLNNNSINAIDPTIFDGKRSLEYVDLSNNECINEIFEGYAIEGIRNTLRSKCKSPEENRQKKIETTSTTTKIPDNYRTTTGRSEFKQGPKKSPNSRIENKEGTTATTEPIERHTTESIIYSKISTYIPKHPSRGPQYFIGEDPRLAKKVKCSMNYHEFPGTGPEIYTCFINDQSINDPEYVIQSTPYNNYVTGIAIDDNKNVKYLPKNIADIFPNINHMSARNNSIINIPSLNNLDKVKTLDLSDNGLDIIDPELFKNLPSLEDLNLSGNQIPLLINNIFENVPKLKSLDLSRNNIAELSPDIFSKLPELRKISLDNNKITDLPENIFINNPKLEVISLNGNKITAINPQTFENLPNLGEVNLEENECISGSFKSGAFYAMKSDIKRNCVQDDFTSLSSSYEEVTEKSSTTFTTEKSKKNQIECDYGDTFSSSTNDYIQSCIINENKIVDDSDWTIKDRPENKRVKRFMVYDNDNIDKLPINLGESFPELADIVVTDSPIKSISPVDFEGLNNIKSIAITGSSIKVLEPETFKGTPQLENLELNGNNIRYVDDDAFKGINKLKNLDLSANKIPKLSKEVLKYLPELKTLKLTGNDLEKIDRDFFKGNPQLYKVHLDENNLKSIDPDAFDRMPHLIDIKLNKNDCIDRSFGTSNMHALRSIVNQHCQPFESLKEELKSCRKEIMKCNSISNSGNDRENSALKDRILKANANIKQLNNQINRLKLENIRILEAQLAEKKKSCAKLDENHNIMIDLNCDYKESDNELYSCDAINLEIKTENSTLEHATGNHKRGKRNADVNSLIIKDQNISHLPNGISSHFPHLNELTIKNSGLKKINQVPLSNLPHLNKLIIRGNNLHQIEKDALNGVPQLEHLDLSHNNIMDMPIEFLDAVPKLQFLNLNDNLLLSLPQSIVPNANNLKTFSVGNNNLKFIDPRIFKRLNGAEIIDFTRNSCIDKDFNRNDDDYMSFIGAVSLKCINEDDDDGFCKGRKT